MRSDALQRYRDKRDFHVTPEPGPKLAPRTRALSFVVQQHDATRMHYDFRLELDGVLKSWAIPKGPSLSPSDRRLAVEVEDHPVSYRDFEGVIPRRQYGAGPVIVWDRGVWEPVGDAHESLAQGHLGFRLHGEKLQGGFALVRLKPRAGAAARRPAWLLLKRNDEHARDLDIAAAMPHSVKSGRTVADVGAGPGTPARAGVRRKPGAAAEPGMEPAPEVVEPQLATLVDRVPEGPYLYEIKYDGYRALATLRRGAIRIASRNEQDWTGRFPRIEAALKKLRLGDAVLDGEICYVLPDGRTDFQHLQNSLHGRREAAQRCIVYFVFDLLRHGGEDLRARPLRERKERLQGLIRNGKGPVRFSEHLSGDGHAVLAQACQLGLEGVIAKRADRPYVAGRTRDWLKLKCQKRQEFVIVGMSAPKKSRHGFGALLLAVNEHGRLRYAGRVGTGFSGASLRELSTRLEQLRADRPAVTGAPRARDVTWVRPELVCQVSYTEATRDGILRHPSFEGLREDKPASQVSRETPAAPPAPPEAKSAAAAPEPPVIGDVKISHPERVMDRASGVTKAGLARYHEALGERLLKHADHRPLALVRCPEGDAAECFFQKHATPGFGWAIHRGKVGDEQVLYVSRPQGLLELVQMNVMELHGWGCRMPAWDKADWLVFDLDPARDVPFKRVAEAAREVKDRLAARGLESFLKTTGGKGLHVVAPLTPRAGWDEAKAFARGIAEDMARAAPGRYVAVASKARREGRIFVDYLRNSRGATAVLPYSPRAKGGATVAMPVAWADLAHLDPAEFTVKSVPEILRRRKRDPWQLFFEARQTLKA